MKSSRPIIHPLSVLLSIIALSLPLVSSKSLGSSLLDIYNNALQNNPGWAAKKAAVRGGKEYVRAGQSGLLPQIAFNAGYSQINYSSPTPSLTDTSNNGLSGIIDCLLGDQAFNTCLDQNPAAQACTSLDFFECLFGSAGSSSSFSSKTYGVSFQQPIFRMDRWYEYRRGQALSRKIKAEFNIAYQDFNLRVIESYFNLLKAQEELTFIKTEEASILFQLNSAKKRFKKGLVSSLDVFETQAVYDLHQASKLLAETQVESAMEDLRQISGAPVDSIRPLPLNIPLDTPFPSKLTSWVDLSKRNNPNLKLAEISTQVANRQHQVARSRRLPQVDFTAGYVVTQSGGETVTISEGETTNTSLSINLRMPIYTGGALTAGEKQARYKKIESDFLRHEVFQLTIASVKKLYLSTLTALKHASAQTVAIKSSEQALSAIRRGYQRSVRSVPEVLDAQRNYYRAKKNYAQARIDYILTSLKLKRAAGLLDMTDVNTINSWLVNDTTENTLSVPISDDPSDSQMLKRLFDNS